MAGKAKKKLDYAGWSVDIFDNDTKIDKLLDAHGWVGFSIYFYLCQRAFGSDGYFYKWGFDDCASTARKMGCGVGSGTVMETVGYCLQIGLFNQRLFDGWGVLTSRGIQRSYWTVARNRRDKSVFKDLWLLEKSECEGVVFVPLNKEMSPVNDHSQATNSDKSPTNDTVVKYSRVEDSRVEGNKRTAKAQALDTDAMVAARHFPDILEAAVNDWITYKGEKGQRYKETGLKNLLTQIENQLDQYGVVRVEKVIRKSMASNYQGIVWDWLKQSKGGRAHGSIDWDNA